MPAASNAVLPNLKTGLFFAIGEGSRIFCRLFSAQQRPNVFVSDPWPAPATYHRSFCEHRGQRVGRSPHRARPAQSLVLSIDVCRGLGISPLRVNIWMSFSQADIGPDRSCNYFFGVFAKSETFFSKICAHSERYRNLLAGIFEILTFYGNIALPLSPVLV